MKIKLTYGRDEDNPEKVLLPTIIYCSTSYGRLLVAGWWDFYIGILWSFKK